MYYRPVLFSTKQFAKFQVVKAGWQSLFDIFSIKVRECKVNLSCDLFVNKHLRGGKAKMHR